MDLFCPSLKTEKRGRNRDYVYRFLSLSTVVDCSKHCFEAANRDCGARPLPNQLCGGTKKVLWIFFARALNQKSEEEIETTSTDFCLLAQWLIAQNTVLRRQMGIAEQGPFLINCAGVLKRSCEPFLPEP